MALCEERAANRAPSDTMPKSRKEMDEVEERNNKNVGIQTQSALAREQVDGPL